jgi:amidase
LKVTRDRTPNLPDGYDYAMGNVVDHVVTRTVRDSAVMLDATGYAEPNSPYPAPAKDRPYAEEIRRSPGKLRITFSSETPNGRAIDAEIQAALERTAALLKGLGHEVIARGLGMDYRALYASRRSASAANFAAGMARLADELGREPEPDELEPLTWAILKAGKRETGADVMRSLQETRMLNRATLAAFEDIDVYLCPVLGQPVPEIGYVDPVNVPPAEVNKRQGRLFPFTPPFNFSGQPSMSLPLEMDSRGLPIGMMFTAKYADEATLFRLAAQLEKEAPWSGRKPQVWG